MYATVLLILLLLSSKKWSETQSTVIEKGLLRSGFSSNKRVCVGTWQRHTRVLLLSQWRNKGHAHVVWTNRQIFCPMKIMSLRFAKQATTQTLYYLDGVVTNRVDGRAQLESLHRTSRQWTRDHIHPFPDLLHYMRRVTWTRQWHHEFLQQVDEAFQLNRLTPLHQFL